jgi:hypothetical protein
VRRGKESLLEGSRIVGLKFVLMIVKLKFFWRRTNKMMILRNFKLILKMAMEISFMGLQNNPI